MRDDDGDWQGRKLDDILDGFRESLANTHKETVVFTPAEKAKAADLRKNINAAHRALSNNGASSQLILDSVWTEVRKVIDVGGVTLTYTSRTDPDNVAIAGWSGGVLESAETGKIMEFTPEFVHVYVYSQGVAMDPAPYLDVEMPPLASYFETDIMKPEVIDKLVDFQCQMQPFGMQDWLASMSYCTADYSLVLLSLYFDRHSLERRAWIRSLMAEIMPTLNDVLEGLAIVGHRSLSALLTGRELGAGTMLINQTTGRVTYDHMATQVIHERLPQRQIIGGIERLAKRILAEANRHFRFYPLNEPVQITDGVPVLKNHGVSAQLTRTRIGSEDVFILTLGKPWRPSRQQANVISRWCKGVHWPQRYHGDLGCFAGRNSRIGSLIEKHLLEDGNVVCIRSPTKEDPILVLEPAIRENLDIAFSQPLSRNEVVSIGEFQKDFLRYVEAVVHRGVNLLLKHEGYVSAVVQAAATHRLFDKLRSLRAA